MIVGSGVKGAVQDAGKWSGLQMIDLGRIRRNREEKREKRRKERRNVRELENWSLAMASFLYKAARGIRQGLKD